MNLLFEMIGRAIYKRCRISLLVLFFSCGLANASGFQEVVRAYAEEMIAKGQDCYGAVHSPLFSTALQRNPTRLFPYPEFQLREHSRPGDRWNYETYFLNIPMLGAPKNGSGSNGDHGMEKPHKQTVSGANPLDNLGLYKAFYTLSEVTGDAKYKEIATRSLRWFYLHTQGPSGLYPWGEHMGWDFRYDYVTYHTPGYENFTLNPYPEHKKEPLTELYQSWQHEPRGMYTDWEPFLDILAELPAKEGEVYTPLEKYALGIWEEHFFDKENGLYNRHGDYFAYKRGIEGRYGGDMMFAKYTGYFVDTWSLAFQHSGNKAFREEIVTCIGKLVEANERLHDQYAYRPVLISGGKYDSRQCLQMAYQIMKAGKRIAQEYPVIGEKAIRYAQKELDYFCRFVGENLDNYVTKDPETIYYAYIHTQDERLLSLFRLLALEVMQNGEKDLSYNARKAARNIFCLVQASRLLKDSRFLKEAGKQGKLAVELYFTPDSPLPKCVPADELTTVDGSKWTTYYLSLLGCDDLMAALIDLDVALRSVQ